jgi:hypothetical protein
MKRRRWDTAVMFMVLFPLLTGCWNAKELEHMFYINTVGIDYQENK